jgi:hypothetical protein
MGRTYKIGQELVCKDNPFPDGSRKDILISYRPSLIDKEGFVEIIGFGKIHIDNFLPINEPIKNNTHMESKSEFLKYAIHYHEERQKEQISGYQPTDKLDTSNPPNDPIFKEMNTETIHTSKKRLEIAAIVLDDFDTWSIRLQEILVGEPRPNMGNPVEFLKWSIKGRVKLKYMIADELLKQENL